MSTAKIKKLEDQIRSIQSELSTLGPMRPGSISTQYNVCGNPNCRCKDPNSPKKHGPYYQLSYTHKGKSTTEFIKRQNIEEAKMMVNNFRRFRKLSEQWIDLSVRLARLRKNGG
jgi:hypothetical protein